MHGTGKRALIAAVSSCRKVAHLSGPNERWTSLPGANRELRRARAGCASPALGPHKLLIGVQEGRLWCNLAAVLAMAT
jgi:hypothetical protein